jgi:predicted metalloprotease
MRWQRGYRSDNVQLRRGGGGLGGLGGLATLLPFAGRFGIGGIALLLLVLFVAPRVCGESAMFTGGGVGTSAPSEADESVQFVSYVLDDAQATWQRLFSERGARYQPAQLVIFRGATSTGCGYGSSAVGPFYCPLDGNVYIDLSFYDELRRRFGAPGDFAEAYVIAHEIGHHVQHQLDLLDDGRGRDNSLSVRTELGADCLAGVWAHSAERRELLEPGDIEEALRAAAAIGDDTMQKRSGGAVQPESWTHGSSEQRVRWYRRGYDAGKLEACDTSRAGEL